MDQRTPTSDQIQQDSRVLTSVLFQTEQQEAPQAKESDFQSSFLLCPVKKQKSQFVKNIKYVHDLEAVVWIID